MPSAKLKDPGGVATCEPVDRDAVFTASASDRLIPGWRRLAFLVMALLTFGCADSREPADEYLLQVGSRHVTVPEFEQAFEISKSAYPWEPEERPELVWIIRRRLLVEMIEELLIFERADELGIAVTEKEVDDYVADIRSDYPEGVFEQMFLEEAIPYEVWRKRTRERMLLNKVIEADMPADGKAPAPSVSGRGDGGAPDGSDDGKIGPPVQAPPPLDGEDRYRKWIGALAARIPVEINTELWKKLYGS
jgi:hypothetical protein